MNLPAAHDAWDNPDCQQVMPDYYLNTTEDTYDSLTDEDRVATIDGLCGSGCGDIYTAYLKMSRRQVGCAAMQQEAEEADEGQGDEGQQQEEEGDDGGGGGRGGGDRRMVQGEEEDDQGFGISVNLNGRNRYRPDDDYPGLLLGCIKDPTDGTYCAVKKGDWSDGDCDFFHSCCYGEYLAGTGTRPLIDRIERKCPGSFNYINMACSSNHTLSTNSIR